MLAPKIGRLRRGMPSSTVRTFTDPDAYHAAIRHTHAEGIVTGRGQFRAELTIFGSIGFLCTAARKPYLASPIPRSTRRSSSSRSRCIEINNYTLAVLKWRTATSLRFARALRRTIGWQPVADGAPSS